MCVACRARSITSFILEVRTTVIQTKDVHASVGLEQTFYALRAKTSLSLSLHSFPFLSTSISLTEGSINSPIPYQNFLREDNIREAIVSGMLPPPSSSPPSSSAPNAKPRSPLTPLLYGLILPLSSSSPSSSSSSHNMYGDGAHTQTQTLDRSNVTSFQFATILFAHLIRHAPQCKALARGIVPPPLNTDGADAIGGGAGAAGGGGGGGGNFFVPADGAPPPVPQSEDKQAEEEDEEDEAPTLLQLLTEHLSLAFLSRGRAAGSNKSGDTEPTMIQSGMSGREQREWDRVIVASLGLLGQWLWEEPKAVREFLEGGGLSLVSVFAAMVYRFAPSPQVSSKFVLPPLILRPPPPPPPPHHHPPHPPKPPCPSLSSFLYPSPASCSAHQAALRDPLVPSLPLLTFRARK